MTPREKYNSKIEVNLEIFEEMFLLVEIKHLNFTCTTEKPELNPQQAQYVETTTLFVWSKVATSRD